MKKIINEMKLRLPALSRNEAVARSVISSFAAELDPTVDELCDVRCAVSEAVTNCIVHGYRGTSGMIVLAAKSFDDRSVRITVIDHGCGIEDIAQARTPLFTTHPDEDRCGMGFSIMESFSDKLTVASAPGKGTRVTLTRKLASPLKTNT